MKTRITLLAFSLISFLHLQANSADEGLKYENLLPDFNQITPEAASLGKYGSIGCSEYTGVPDIKVPLFDIKSRNLSVPVYLYYDASGIKVEQEATFVGLGWNLSYGGCVTHIVCGKDDYNSSLPENEGAYRKVLEKILLRPYGEYYSLNRDAVVNLFRIRPFWIDYTIVLTWQLYYGGYTFYKDEDLQNRNFLDYICDGYYCPDVFQASFCGHSVTFIIDYEKQIPVIIGDDATKYKIEYYHNDRRYPNEFAITDSEGITYKFKAFCEFGNREDSYFLDSIVDIDGELLVKYSYEQSSLAQTCHPSFYQSTGCARNDGESKLSDKCNSLFIQEQSKWSFDNFQMFKVYPAAIETNQEKVMFEYEGREDMVNGKRIERINVFSKNGSARTHLVDFKYDYFEEQSYGGLATDVPQVRGHYSDRNAKKRLKLIGAILDGKTHSFGYEESQPLPYKTSLSQDYWGYYNGINNKTHFCATPQYKMCDGELTEIPYVGDANRNCSEAYSKVGILNRITYPTGGYSTFEYEVNHFDSPDYQYYPCAEDYSQKSTYKVVLTQGSATVNAGVDMVETRRDTIILTESKEVTVQYGLHREKSGEYVYVRMDGPGAALYYSINGNDKVLEGAETMQLTPGTYVITAHAEAVSNNPPHYNTLASIIVTRDSLRRVPLNLSDVSDDSGNSIGGGLRIKSIKNYSGGNQDHCLGETEYHYSGGRLLIPTVNAQDLSVEEGISNYHDSHLDHAVLTSRFYFTGSQTSFLPICSLGSPTVGYSSVTKIEKNKEGSVERKTITDFHNQGFSFCPTINGFYHDNHGMNGKTKNVIIISADGDTLSKTDYEYLSKANGRILFPWCRKNYIWSTGVNLNYSIAAFSKSNVWHYMTKKIETQYEGGKPMKPIVTDYTYNNDNYQTSKSTRRQGTQAIEDRYQYSVDGVAVGSDLLIDKHILSRLTGTRQYLNGNLTGGAQLDFREHDTIQHDRIPVVKMYRNILPSGKMDTVLTVVDYDERGNIREYVTKNGTHTTILWSHNYQYPVMQIVGATYEDVKRAYHAISVIGKQKTISLSMMKTLHNKFSAIKEGELQVTAYVYDPWYGVSDIIQPNGKVMHYDKDSQGRLSKILEDSASGPVVQRFFYHYRKQ